jgi:ligand-binding sensor domain-containing protein
MTKYYLYRPTYYLLLVLSFVTSANGQTKLIKTQGTGQNDNLQCGLQDKVGNLWFGTSGEGVYRYDGKTFTNFTEKDGLCNNSVLCILQDRNGNIWLGTNTGLCRYDGKNFTNIPIAAANGSNLRPSTYSDIDPHGRDGVWSMMQDRSGKLWFGTFDGVYCYNGIAFSRFLDNDGVINKDSVRLQWVESILEDKDGNIWFGGRTNLGAFRYDGTSITKFFKPAGAEKWVRPLIQDKAGNIWFGVYGGGVIRYDGKTFARFAQKEVVGWIFYMVEDHDGNLWFSSNSRDGGVTCYDPVSGVFKYFTMKDCQSNYQIWNIMGDNKGNIWLGTKNVGLCRYDGKTFTNFSE